MKKLLATFLTLAMMAILVPLSVNAQTGNRNCRVRRSSYQNNQYRNRKYYGNRGYETRQYREKQNIYQRHRNLINIGIGGGAGAIIGGIIGGKRGAAIGLGVGAGSGAAYTYGINPKDKTKRRRYYRRP